MPTINVKTFQGQTYPIETELSITVAELKTKIEAATGSASDTLRVICSGRVLSDDAATLASAGVADGATLHIVAISASAAPAAPATPATPAPQQSLFSGSTPSSSSGSSGNSASGSGAPVNPQMMQMLQSPQGQQLVRAILQNPNVLQQLAQDPQMGQLMRNPEFARALSDPRVMEQVLGSAGGGGMGGMGGMGAVQRPYPAIPRDIFDDGMAVLNGGALGQRYVDAAKEHEEMVGSGGSGGGGGGSSPWTEVFARDKVNAACDTAFGPPPVAQGSSGPAVTPAASASTPTPAAVATPAAAAAAAATTAAATPAATADAGASMDSAADDPVAVVAAGDDAPTADSSMEVEAGSVTSDAGQPPPPAASPIAADAPPPAAAAAATPAASAATPESLAQLAAMGFTNEALNRQALEAANGDVGMALTFLMGGP